MPRRAPLIPLTTEQRDLVAANMGLAYWMMLRRLSMQPLLSEEEIFSACCMGLVIASKHWDESRGTFSTIAKWAMCSEIANEVKAKLRGKRLAPKGKREANELMGRREYPGQQIDIDDWLATLDDRELAAVSGQLEGRTLAAIGADLGISREWVRKITKRAYERRAEGGI